MDWIVSPQKSYEEFLISSVTASGDRAYLEGGTEGLVRSQES